MNSQLNSFTDVLCNIDDEICDSQPLSLSSDQNVELDNHHTNSNNLDDKLIPKQRPAKGTGRHGQFRSVEEIDEKYRSVFSYPFFNLVQSRVIDDALYTDKSMVVSAPTGSGKTVVFEMAIVQLLMEMEDNNNTENSKIIYMAPVKALCTERLTEWYPKFTKLGLFCIEVTGDTDVDFSQLAPYRIIITTPEKWDVLTRRWRDYRRLVEQIKLFLIDEVHILNDPVRGPVLEAVVSRMKTIESSAQSAYRIEQLQNQYRGEGTFKENPPKIRFVAVSATVGNPGDVASWLGNEDRPAVYYTFGDESRPVKLRRVVEGYPCAEGTSIFKFDIILNYKLWPIIQKYHDGKPTLIFCNTRKSVMLTAETLSREITVTFTPEQKAKLIALASTFKNKKLQSLILSGVGCHHAGLLYEERTNIEHAFRNRDLPILITTTTLAMGVNLPAHLVIIKNTQQYVNGAYQEYSISTILQMVGRAGRPQYDTEATAVIMTRLSDKGRYQALVGGSEPLQSYLHKRLAENLNSEAALGTVGDVAQCVQWLRSTFLFVRAARDPKRYLGLPQAAPQNHISKKIEELCVKAMNGLASSGLITMDEASCIESTEAGRLMSIYYLDLETMKHIMKINGTETLEQLLWIVCESHELADMHLRVDERRYLNALNRNKAASTIRFSMKGKINTRQMKVNCLIQAILGCLPISDPSLNQEAMKIMRIADRVCKCLIAYVTQSSLLSKNPKFYSAVLNSAILAKCVVAHLWENSPYVSKQLRGIGPTFSTLLATAGKVTFATLEESHPRDLERIMKRGAPAGNLLRKEISLLPKYQLTITPIDEKSVTIKLDLINCIYIMEHIDNLTAGNTHKSYVIVGDSENNILLLTSFNDSNLISVYNGSITFEISRIHNFEHKIFAHCISSTFVGIDANCDYIFKDLEPLPDNVNETIKRSIQKQTTITNTFKERKRKCSDTDITQSKEKKKRDNNIITKFQNLKESFAKTSKAIKDDLERTAAVSSEKNLEGFNQFHETIDVSKEVSASYVKPIVLIDGQPTLNNNNSNISEIYGVIPPLEDDDNDEFDKINNDKINDILNEIESEMNRVHVEPKQSPHLKNSQNIPSISPNTKATTKTMNETQFKRPNTSQMNKKCTKNILPVKSNYNFIDLLERNVDLNDDEEKEESTIKQNTFSLNIKQYIDKFINQVEKQNKVPDRVLIEILDTTNKNTNEAETSKYTDNSKLPEYVELNKIRTPSINVEQNEIVDNSPNNEHTYQIWNVIRTSDPNEKLETQNTIQNYTDSMALQKSNNEENNMENNIALVCDTDTQITTAQNVKSYQEIPNTEISVNGTTIVMDVDDEQLKIIPDEVNQAKICPLASQLINKTKPLSLENNCQIAPISTDENTHNNVLTGNIYSGFTESQKNNQSEFVTKYSYATGQINIITKVTNNSIVRITRKLHLNLEITKTLDKDTVIKINEDLDNFSTNMDFPEPAVTTDNFVNDQITKTTPQHDLSVQVYNSDLTAKSTCPITDPKYGLKENDREIVTKHSPLINSSNDTTAKRDIGLEFEENKMSKENRNENTFDQNYQIDKSKSTEENSNTTNENKDINNILRKYSEIMRKKTVEVNSQNSIQNIKFRPNEPKTVKPKRPFKISDINKYNSQLPNITQVTQIKPVSHGKSNINESKVINTKPETPIPNLSTVDFIKQSKCDLTPEKENAIPIFDKEIIRPDFEPLEDLKTLNDNIEEMIIDPTMFNPKTLLQCFSNDNEQEDSTLLPPPPEFCDSESDSPIEMELPAEYYDPKDWNDDFDFVENSNIFRNDLDVDLTPSKEIETWNLSQDNGNNAPSFSYQPQSQSYTVLNENLEQQQT